MRLDARNGDSNWSVFHVPACRKLNAVVWVDDDLHQYGAYADDSFSAFLMGPLPHKVNRVQIILNSRTVLIDPIEDGEPESVSDVIEAARLMPADTSVSTALHGAASAPGFTARGVFCPCEP